MGTKRRLGTATRAILILVVLGIAVFPLYWMLTTSLTSNIALFGEHAQLVPDPSQAGRYVQVFHESPVGRWLLNSLIVAAGTAALSVALAIPLGYGLARFRFRGKNGVTLGLLLTQMLPAALLVVPLFGLFKTLGLLNSLGGLIVADTAFALPVISLLVRIAIEAIPRELEDAARVDGCSAMGVLLRINVPLIAPTLAAAAVISFFDGWNEYVFSVTFIFDAVNFPASVGLASYIGEQMTSVQSVMAVGLMYTLPAVVFYLFIQRYVVSGLTAGGVKA